MLLRVLSFVLLASFLHAQTGTAVPSMSAVDTAMNDFLTRQQIPGGSLSIAFQGRLIYARGFGRADRDTSELVQPDSLFRLASVSKSVSSLSLLRLIDQGKLTLDDRPFANQLRNLPLPPNTVKHATWDTVTVRQLLQHTAGLPPAGAGDPLNAPEILNIATAYGTATPATMAQAIGYTLTRAPLTTPGSTHTYSNLSIGVIGRLIQAVSGKTYERFVIEDVLAPLGITRMSLGAALRTGRKASEVRHHEPVGTALVPSVYSGGGNVELPYGGYAHESFEAAGAWLASSIDILRLFTRFNSNGFLSANAIAELIKRPPAPVSQTGSTWYGLGMQILDRGSNRYTVFHSGSLPGTRTYYIRTFGGGANDVAYTFTFNMRRVGDADFLNEAIQAIERAAFGNGTANLPTHDLWPQYFAADRVVNAASFRSGAVSPGQIITIFGERLGGATLTTAAVVGNRLTTTLNGTRVLFDDIPAPLVYTSANQISAIVPYGVSTRSLTQMRVEYQGATAFTAPLQVVPASPAFFTANSSGSGPAAAIKYPEARIAVLYATGEGLLTPSPEDGTLSTAPLPTPQLPVKVFLDNTEVPILYVGAAPGLTVGLLQINIQIPESLANRPNLPLILEIGGVRSIAGVTL